MVIDGKIGLFLHVLDPKESNALQTLALKSRLKISLLLELTPFMVMEWLKELRFILRFPYLPLRDTLPF